jgi:predicted permease
VARAAGRRKELAVRAALGAGRGRLIRQMVTESTMLALLGGVLGLALAPAGMRVLAGLVPLGLSGSALPTIDPRLLVFTLALSLLTGVVFSMAPAIQAATASLDQALKQSGRANIGGGGRMRDALVVVEVGSALVLLVGAGLMLQTMAKLRAIDVGFRPENLLTLRTMLPNQNYDTPEKRQSFYDRVLDGVRALPGVETAAYASMLPSQSTGFTETYWLEGRAFAPSDPHHALLRAGTEDYLKTLGVRLLEGRLLDARDRQASAHAVVINRTFANLYWPGQSALGSRIHLDDPQSPAFTIVGVIEDVRERGYQVDLLPGVYLVHPNSAWAQPDRLVVRVQGDPSSLAGAVRRVIAQVDPDEPVSALRTMEDLIAVEVTDRKQQMTLLGAFAGLALVLAAIGLYSVLSHAVAQRYREIGVRIALGATASSVVRMMVSRGMALTGIGLALGLGAAWAATQAMKKMLFGVSASDPATYAIVVALLGLVALAASWIPAARAARIDPIVVLREE